MRIILFIAIGLLIGFVAEKKLKRKGCGLVTCLFIAIVGSLMGGWITGSLDFTSQYDQDMLSFAASFGGSIMMVGLGYVVTRS